MDNAIARGVSIRNSPPCIASKNSQSAGVRRRRDKTQYADRRMQKQVTYMSTIIFHRISFLSKLT